LVEVSARAARDMTEPMTKQAKRFFILIEIVDDVAGEPIQTMGMCKAKLNGYGLLGERAPSRRR
jgi:hypothetical protein